MNRQVLDLWNRYRPTIAVDAIEYDRELRQLLSTNLASLGTDCISRQSAIDALERAKQNIRHNIERAIGRAICEILDEVENGIKQLPPIQPKRGKWIDTKGNTEWYAREYECSECGGTMLGESNFCPNCGADMRGEQDG